MSEWQLIDTAPKDGTRILLHDIKLAVDGRDRVIGHWYTHPSVQGWITSEIDCNDYEFAPTHWMPLPSPPPTTLGVVIRKNGYFYRPDWRGYTASIHEAGRYDRADAEKHAADTEGVTVHEIHEFMERRAAQQPAEKEG